MSTQDLINKLWSLCHLLRDDGVTYNEYLNELTFLVFLKMVEETGQEKLIPEGTVGKTLKSSMLQHALKNTRSYWFT